MRIRVVLAALITIALALSGVGHVLPAKAAAGMPGAMAVERQAVGHDGHAAHRADPAHHADAERRPAPAKATGPACVDPQDCTGCAAHCPAIAALAVPPLPVLPRPSAGFMPPVDHLESGALIRLERPPEAI